MKLCIGLKIIKDQNQVKPLVEAVTILTSTYAQYTHTHTHTEESNFIYLVIWNYDLKSKHVLYEDRDQTFRSHFSRVELSLIGLEQIRSSGDLRESTLWRSFCHQSNKKKFVIANQFTKNKKNSGNDTLIWIFAKIQKLRTKILPKPWSLQCMRN